MFAQVKGQEEKRRVEHFVDQHGREYVANVEKETGDPCEALKPLFTAPLGPDWFTGKLVPPEKYRKMVPMNLRGRKGYQVEVDYVQWLQDLEERKTMFEQKLHDFARGAAKGGADIEKIVNDPPPVIRELLGTPPFPPIVLVRAMRAGNAWAVGETEKIPVKVEALLEELRPVVQRMKRISADDPIIDPLADDDAGTEFVAALAETHHDPFAELDEVFDPEAVGNGKRHKVGKQRQRGE